MSKEAQKTLQEKRLAFLNDTLAYYEADPVNRRNAALGDTGCGNHAECTYAPQHAGTEGCAIGRHLPLELAKRLDYWSDSSVNNPIVFNRLPDALKELGKVFLGDMQHLHDRGPLWIENDCQTDTAAERRANYVASLKKDYNLE
jgi:hypothetical protein